MRQQVENSHLDVFCASETWLTSSIPNTLLELKGFNLARLDRSWNETPANNQPKKGGGLICYAKANVNMNETRYSSLNKSNKDLEMQWISLEMKNMRRIIIINIYRPPKGDYKRACKLIRESVREANLKDNAEIFVMGDFNINWNDKKAPATKELDHSMSLWGLKPFFRESTRLGNSKGILKGTCIDNIFSNSDNIKDARILHWNFSDHLVVSVTRKREKIVINKVNFTGRSYKDYVKEDLQRELIDLDWGDFYEADNPTECWEIIESTVRGYLNRVCPQKLFKVKELREPWVTNELLEEIKYKDRLVRVAKRSGKLEDWRRARMERNKVGRLVETTKGEFLKEQQEELADDPNKFWRLIKSLVPNKKKGKSKKELSHTDEAGVESEVCSAQVAEFINDFFCGIGP